MQFYLSNEEKDEEKVPESPNYVELEYDKSYILPLKIMLLLPV